MIRISILTLFVVVNVFVWTAARPQTLSVSFFDVGQGDAIFIESPTGVQMLIDGGADRSVLRELGRHMSFFDRSIDVVVATHPDQDHIGGLPDVFKRYEVGTYIESGKLGNTVTFSALEMAVTEERLSRIVAKRGMRLLLGSGVYADILFPDRDVSEVEANAASIIMRVVYGDNEFLLTGDSPKSIEGLLVSHYGKNLESDVLKAGHHGSKTSSSERFVEVVSPQYVIVSAGVNNRYGHPHQEVLDVFDAHSIPVLETNKEKTIRFVTDGFNLRRK